VSITPPTCSALYITEFNKIKYRGALNPKKLFRGIGMKKKNRKVRYRKIIPTQENNIQQ